MEEKQIWRVQTVLTEGEVMKSFLIAVLTSITVPLIIVYGLVAFVKADLSHSDEIIVEVMAETESSVKTANFDVRRASITEKGEYAEREIEVVELPLELVKREAEEVVDPTDVEEVIPLFRCDGRVLDTDLQEFLWKCLHEHGIGYFYPYAIALARQESGYDLHDVSYGTDCGLFQYRSTYWAEVSERWGYKDADIFNPYIQIDIFCHQMAKRLNELGCTINEAISRHMMSDWGNYNPKYVEDVMCRYDKLERIR